MIKDLERKMEGLVGLDTQEQLLAILQSLSKEEIEKIPDGAGTVTSLNTGEQHRKRGLFVAYRRRCNLGSTDRIWRFFPLNGNPINNITEIVSQIRFDRSKNAERRIDEENLQRLAEARLRIEHEIADIAAERRTTRITGRMRKVLELAKKTGRADIYDFLQWCGKKIESNRLC